LTFEFHRFRFHFRAIGSLFFQPYKSGNIVRGAFGTLFRRLVCNPGCTDARTCDVRAACPYAQVFEPKSARAEGPSGLADWPRPFVFRAAHLDGQTIVPGHPFYFDVHIFDIRQPLVPYFVAAFARLAQEGLGPHRGRAELTAVDQLDRHGAVSLRLYSGGSFQAAQLAPPVSLDLDAPARTVHRVRVRFVTPTELKSGHSLVDEPHFGAVFARLRDRIGNLRALYGAGPLEVDFRALGERASLVRMTGCTLIRHEVERRSSRTGQRHPLGGFTGEAEYEGDLAEFVPYLFAGQWTGVGRQTVWGKGELHTAVE
jgi:hypothetical protein